MNCAHIVSQVIVKKPCWKR